MGWLGHRYRLEWQPDLFDAQGFLAGSDARRLGELNSALRSDVAAIVAARGGYGLSRIAHQADWQALARNPKWLVGFSDVTLMHAEASRVGVATLHADNISGLGRGDDSARQRWVAALERPLERREYRQLEVVHPGYAGGRLAGGNLTLLFCCAAAGRLLLPPGCILFFEEVAESSYRIDRMLTSLRVSGALSDVAGVVIGSLTDCSQGRYSVDAIEVIADCLRPLGIPVLAGLKAGHGRDNKPLLLGGFGELDAGCARLAVGDQ